MLNYFRLLYVIIGVASIADVSIGGGQKASNHVKSQNPKFSMYTSKSRQIDCGYVEIDEDYDELSHIYQHDDIVLNKTTYNDFVMFMDEEEDIDATMNNNNRETKGNDPKLSFNLKTVSNLSACLADSFSKRQLLHPPMSNNSFTSYSTHFSSKVTQFVFDSYFYLDEKSGIVYSKKRIDREVFCAKVASEISKLSDVRLNKQKWSSPSPTKNKTIIRFSNKSSRNATSRKKLQKRRAATPSLRKHTNTLNPNVVFKPSILINTKFHDTVNCDCRSEKCEINFRFIAFKDSKVAEKTNSLSAQPQAYKYLTLKININDLNDNSPKFAKNSLYLNISESFGINNNKADENKKVNIYY
jgi:hypothetical protein